MNWNAVGAIGEVFGAIAVFVTLAYLAVQVRHARQETGRSTTQARADAIRQMFSLAATDARLLDANLRARRAMGVPPHPFINALMEQTGLEEEGATLVHLWTSSLFQVFLQMVQNRDNLPAGERSATNIQLKTFFGMDPIGRLFYETVKGVLDQDAVRYIDSVLAQPT